MEHEDLRNHEKLAQVLRYCGTCDPLAVRAGQSAPAVCTSCGHDLLVVTSVSGKYTEDQGKQYEGVSERYAHPVSHVTGQTEDQRQHAVWNAAMALPASIPDDDIPF